MFILERQLGPLQAESMSGKEIKTDLSHDKSIAHIENETQTRAQEIVDRAIERGLFGDHVLGRTPEKSMQARLSMDILRGPEDGRPTEGEHTIGDMVEHAARAGVSVPILCAARCNLQAYEISRGARP
jgi:hypothetical protein